MKHLTMAFIRRDFLSYESKYMRLYSVSGMMLTYTGSMLHIRAPCYVYGLCVKLLIYGLYVTYTGYFIYIMRILQVICFKL